MAMTLFLLTTNTNPGVAVGPSVSTRQTPFVQRNVVLKNSAITAGTILVQTAGIQDPTFTNPTTVATVTATSPTTTEIVTDNYIRYNVTSAVTGIVTLHIEGTQ